MDGDLRAADVRARRRTATSNLGISAGYNWAAQRGAAPNGEQRGKRRRGGCLTEEAIRAAGGGDGGLSLDKVAEGSVKVGERSQGTRSLGCRPRRISGPKSKARRER